MTQAAPIAMTTLQDAIHSWLVTATGLTWIWRDQSAPQPAYPYGSIKLLSGPIPTSNEWQTSHEVVTHAETHSIVLTPPPGNMKNNHAYTIYLDTIAITYTTGASATAKEIVEGLKAKIIANVTLNAKLTVTENDVAITIVGKTASTNFTIRVLEPAILVLTGYTKEILLSATVPCTLSFSCQAYVGLTDSRDPAKDARSYLDKASAAIQLPTCRDALKAANLGLVNCGPVQNISEVVGETTISRANMDVTFGATLSASEYATWIQKVEVKNTEFDIDDTYDVGT